MYYENRYVYRKRINFFPILNLKRVVAVYRCRLRITLKCFSSFRFYTSTFRNAAGLSPFAVSVIFQTLPFHVYVPFDDAFGSRRSVVVLYRFASTGFPQEIVLPRKQSRLVTPDVYASPRRIPPPAHPSPDRGARFWGGGERNTGFCVRACGGGTYAEPVDTKARVHVDRTPRDKGVWRANKLRVTGKKLPCLHRVFVTFFGERKNENVKINVLQLPSPL